MNSNNYEKEVNDYFASIIGHKRPLEYLKKAIDTNEYNHAYLFIGPPGIGKMLTARAFAYSVLGLEDSEAHIYLQQQMHPDLKIIEKLEGKARVAREQIITDFEPWLAVKPYRADHRIIIIKDASSMTLEAANALLKTLEEPPKYAIIILIADGSNLLETIISRCRVISFSALSPKQIKEYLFAKGYTNQLDRISLLAQGSLDNAIELAEDESRMGVWQKASQILLALSAGDIGDVIHSLEGLNGNSELIITTLETILRDMLIFKKTDRLQDLYFPDSIEIIKQIKNVDYNKLNQAIIDIHELKKLYNSNSNTMVVNLNIFFKIKRAIT